MRLPHPLTLLVGCTIIAAALTHVLPAGKFDMREDPASGRKVAVAGSYHRVPAQPVTPFQTVVGVADGRKDAASLNAVVLLGGGGLGVALAGGPRANPLPQPPTNCLWAATNPH